MAWKASPFFVVLASLLAGCGGDDPSGPTARPLVVEFDEPVEARFESTTRTFIVELAVRARRPGGGIVEFVETVVRDVSRSNQVIARNRRPNAEFAFPERSIPVSGAPLVVEAAVGFPPPPPRDELSITVEVGLTTGESAERSARLVATLP